MLSTEEFDRLVESITSSRGVRPTVNLVYPESGPQICTAVWFDKTNHGFQVFPDRTRVWGPNFDAEIRGNSSAHLLVQSIVLSGLIPGGSPKWSILCTSRRCTRCTFPSCTHNCHRGDWSDS